MRSVTLTRKGFPFALALLAGALLYHAPGHGVTLGNIASQSGLGQPLHVVIPMTLASGEALHVSCLKLVADNTSGAPQIVTGRVNLEQATTNKPRLIITTPTAVYEPAVRLSVQAGCGSTSRRDYVVLLDPPALESATTVASADADDPPWIVAARQRAIAERAERANAHPSLQRVAAINPEPSPASRLPSWGTPFEAGPVTPMVPPPSKAVETKAPAPVVASAPPTPAAAPRAFVNMVGSSSAFIPEASAAPLPPRPATTIPLRQTTTAQSIPLIPRPQPQVSLLTTLWQQSWQYVVAVGGMLVLGFGAFAMRRRFAMMFMRANAVSLRGETQAAPVGSTFAHFEAMTEPAPIKPRAPITRPDASANQAVAVEEFDTLLHDIRSDTSSDTIDEQAIKEAWKDAATDSAVDIGTDSILKAIAAAERDLEVGSRREPRIVTDRALDDLTVPNEPKKSR